MKASFSRFKSRLTTFDIDFSISEEEILKDLDREIGNDRLLERFSVEEVTKALSRYGVLQALADRGFPQPKTTIRSIDPFRQTLKIFASIDSPEDDEHLLCELRVFDAHLKGPCPLTGKPFEVDALVIDWLNFQNPNGKFGPDKPRLPGQRYPGLGIMRISMNAILDLAQQIGKEAVINIPEYYHNAVLDRPAFHFFSAFVEGRFNALERFFGGRSLSNASNSVAAQTILNETSNELFVWKPHEQILGLTARIRDYFKSDLYKQKVREAESASRFRFIDELQRQS